jgi:hypothetical protein
LIWVSQGLSDIAARVAKLDLAMPTRPKSTDRPWQACETGASVQRPGCNAERRLAAVTVRALSWVNVGSLATCLLTAAPALLHGED